MPNTSTDASNSSTGKRKRVAPSNSPEDDPSSSTGTSRRKGDMHTGQATEKDWHEKNKDRDPITLSLPAVSENIRKLLNALNSDTLADERDTLNAAYDELVANVNVLADQEQRIFDDIARLEDKKKEEEEKSNKNGETVEYLDQCIQAEKSKRSPLRDRYNNTVGKYRSVCKAIEKNLKIPISARAYTDKKIVDLAKKIDEGNK